ncbi:MAG: CDP-alcohol phosphatidyltransferase family protein [Aestuariivirga sp.]|uniref:CDP-alcohol phosphatidyltransferase family protein n=1 Tax=Aestuariivirga sp. TaxID=2650926 RepID=UPI0038D09023
MLSGHRLGLSQIIRNHRETKLAEEFSTEWAVAVLYRPPALLIAWACQYLPVTPIMVTAAAGLLLPLMVLAAAWMPPGAALAVVTALACLFMILDCADGTLARITGQTSRLGQYLDAATDLAYRVVSYGAAGYILARHPAASPWFSTAALPLALIAAWIMTFARLCRVYAELRFPPSAQREEERPQPRMDLAGFVSGLDGLFPLFVLAAWVLAAPAALLWWIFAYALADVVYTQIAIIQRLRGASR